MSDTHPHAKASVGKDDDGPEGETEFDQTNGLAGDLDGDDGGSDAAADDGSEHSLFGDLLVDPDARFDERDADSGYGSEGAE